MLIIAAVYGLYTIARNQHTSINDSGRIKVAASFYPLYYFASQIAGDKVDIINITPAGAEPHDYEPTPQDIAYIETSNLVILNGGSLEVWAEKIKKDLQDKHVTIVTAGENIINKTLVEEGKKIQDPHVWLNPILAKQEVDKITQGLIQVDPANQAYYETSRTILEAKLDGLDVKYKEGLSLCTKKDIVTSHAAFGYLADQYGLNQINITGISPDEEPSPQRLAEISDFVKKNNIKYIFFESLISPKLSETIANETGAQTLVLDPIEGISAQDQKDNKDYMTQMEMNLNHLRLALECK